MRVLEYILFFRESCRRTLSRPLCRTKVCKQVFPSLVQVPLSGQQDAHCPRLPPTRRPMWTRSRAARRRRRAVLYYWCAYVWSARRSDRVADWVEPTAPPSTRAPDSTSIRASRALWQATLRAGWFRIREPHWWQSVDCPLREKESSQKWIPWWNKRDQVSRSSDQFDYFIKIGK